jgi:subtilisin-like proprotein convertase family protein
LDYSWTTIGSNPGPVSFSSTGTNASKNITATFGKASNHTLRATVREQSKVVTGEIRPRSSFSNFIGESLFGIWKLEIIDHQQNNTGSLISWSMDITSAATNHHIYEAPDPLEGRQELVVDFNASRNLSIPLAYIDGGGTWSTIMPPSPTIFPINVNFVGELSEILFVRLSFYHYMAGDLHAVLVSPSGTKVTIFHRPGSTSGSGGNTGQFVDGEYKFYELWNPLLPDSGNISPGSYRRDPGDWPGLPNDWEIPIGSFEDFVGEPITGTWNLIIFDWNNNSNYGLLREASLSLKFLV